MSEEIAGGIEIRDLRLVQSMPGIDQILSFIVQQGADELRLGTDDEPRTFSKGARRHFTMARTPDAVLRQLLGEILSPDREALLADRHRLCFDYAARGAGTFQVTLEARAAGGLEVMFTQSASGSLASVARPTAAAAVAHTSVNSSHFESSKERSRAGDSSVTCTEQLRELVQEAIKRQASDIHLADDEVAYLRVDGRLQPVNRGHLSSIEELFQLDPDANKQLSAGVAVEMALSLSPRERLRVTLYRKQSGLAAAIRVLAAEAPDLGELNLPLSLSGLAELPNGLVLFCGATGSGKSTTLAALSRHALEHRSILLITLEDPIEFQLSSSTQSIARQRQIGRDVESFTSGLRDALRSDPDVIVVGELRDAETIRLALTAAETGHLVLASLHGGSASACVERVIDAYPADHRPQIRIQLAEALRAVVVQKLLPRARSTGRVVALEVLRITHAAANVIREGKTAQIGTLIQGGKREGMICLERCLADYVQAGVLTLDQARAAANDLDSLTMYLGK